MRASPSAASICATSARSSSQQRVAHTRLIRICFNDYDREIALVAEQKDANGKSQIVGVARLSKLHSTNAGEFAVVVTDHWQHKGLGTELTKRLVQIAKNEKLDRLVAYTLRENKDMQQHVQEGRLQGPHPGRRVRVHH